MIRLRRCTTSRSIKLIIEREGHGCCWQSADYTPPCTPCQYISTMYLLITILKGYRGSGGIDKAAIADVLTSPLVHRDQYISTMLRALGLKACHGTGWVVMTRLLLSMCGLHIPLGIAQSITIFQGVYFPTSTYFYRLEVPHSHCTCEYNALAATSPSSPIVQNTFC